MKRSRPNARRDRPKPGGKPMPDEPYFHQGRRKEQGSPVSIVEAPLDHFTKASVEGRVQDFLTSKLNNPQTARARNKNAAPDCSPNATKTNNENVIIPNS